MESKRGYSRSMRREKDHVGVSSAPRFNIRARVLVSAWRIDCGCGECPTVFFQVHQQGDAESDLVTAQGRDESGGLVAAVLLEKNGALSQLEFYSIDGHSPWSAPKAATLEPW